MCEATSRLDATIGEVADRHRDGRMSSDELVALLGARERLDAVMLAGLSAWDRDKVWELDGARSPVAWLAHRVPVTRQEASGLVRSARHVHRFERTAKALDAGTSPPRTSRSHPRPRSTARSSTESTKT